MTKKMNADEKTYWELLKNKSLVVEGREWKLKTKGMNLKGQNKSGVPRIDLRKPKYIIQ